MRAKCESTSALCWVLGPSPLHLIMKMITMIKLCPKCNGKGKIPIDFSGPMYYYNPNTGESWPHKKCDICDGKGAIKE
jgi:DnaJ-class molecular chaperone